MTVNVGTTTHPLGSMIVGGYVDMLDNSRSGAKAGDLTDDLKIVAAFRPVALARRNNLGTARRETCARYWLRNCEPPGRMFLLTSRFIDTGAAGS